MLMKDLILIKNKKAYNLQKAYLQFLFNVIR